MSYTKQELLTLLEHLDSLLGFSDAHVANYCSFVRCVVFLCFVCLRTVSCVANVASVSGLSILDYPF